jgi:hypothetical protein
MAPTARRPAVLLGQANLDPARARRTLETVERSVRHLIELTQKLETVARMHNDGTTRLCKKSRPEPWSLKLRGKCEKWLTRGAWRSE